MTSRLLPPMVRRRRPFTPIDRAHARVDAGLMAVRAAGWVQDNDPASTRPLPAVAPPAPHTPAPEPTTTTPETT